MENVVFVTSIAVSTAAVHLRVGSAAQEEAVRLGGNAAATADVPRLTLFAALMARTAMLARSAFNGDIRWDVAETIHVAVTIATNMASSTNTNQSISRTRWTSTM